MKDKTPFVLFAIFAAAAAVIAVNKHGKKINKKINSTHAAVKNGAALVASSAAIVENTAARAENTRELLERGAGEIGDDAKAVAISILISMLLNTVAIVMSIGIIIYLIISA